jgi:macrodomain Ter protein organizer (MatP/YcbG family)
MSAHTAKGKRTVRADIPTDVWDRLAVEAAAKGVPLGRHLANLIVARDRKRRKDA